MYITRETVNNDNLNYLIAMGGASKQAAMVWHRRVERDSCSLVINWTHYNLAMLCGQKRPRWRFAQRKVYSEYTERERKRTNGAIIQTKYQKKWTAFCNISIPTAISL
jgi:hypothetical protein